MFSFWLYDVIPFNIREIFAIKGYDFLQTSFASKLVIKAILDIEHLGVLVNREILANERISQAIDGSCVDTLLLGDICY